MQGDARVCFDYDADADGDLTIKEGDIIRNIEKKEDCWWEGELNGKRGMFPAYCVEDTKKPVEGIEVKAREKNEVSTCPAAISIHNVNIAHTAISIMVVPKKMEKVEYEGERLTGKD